MTTKNYELLDGDRLAYNLLLHYNQERVKQASFATANEEKQVQEEPNEKKSKEFKKAKINSKNSS